MDLIKLSKDLKLPNLVINRLTANNCIKIKMFDAKNAYVSSYMLALYQMDPMGARKYFYNEYGKFFHIMKKEGIPDLPFPFQFRNKMGIFKFDKQTYIVVKCNVSENFNINSGRNVANQIFEMLIIGKNNKLANEYLSNASTNVLHKSRLHRMKDSHNQFLVDITPKDNRRKSVNKKDFNSIFIDKKIKDELIYLTRNYIKNSIELEKNNLPGASFGILLYGNPGTGKSSIAKAIATEIASLDNEFIYATLMSLDVSDVEASIQNLMREPEDDDQVRILLLNDIDCVIEDRSSNIQGTSSVSYRKNFQALLSLLDDIGSNSTKYIIVATTNHVERLDPALIREGRFDFKYEISDISKEIAEEMCEYYHQDSSVLLKDEIFPINPAYLQSKIMKNVMHTNL